MNDHELLEMAAKAAGMEWCHWYEESQLAIVDHRPWNPLIDDGDALRLAVKLRINIENMVTMGGQWAGYNCWPVGRGDCASRNDDYKRAIVECAAEIGASMP